MSYFEYLIFDSIIKISYFIFMVLLNKYLYKTFVAKFLHKNLKPLVNKTKIRKR